jgi:protein TonB
MLAYAAQRPRIAERKSSPNALLFVICAHIVVIAAVISAKMDLPARIRNTPQPVIFVPAPPLPPPSNSIDRPHQTTHEQLTRPTTSNPVVEPVHQSWDPGPIADPGPITIGDGGGFPSVTPQPRPIVASTGVELLTPASELKPPYPESKLLNEEEAALRLRLTIDDHGRVVAVDPVGSADSVFLAAARRHLMAHWRYKPATQNGQAIASTIVITLRFQLDG